MIDELLLAPLVEPHAHLDKAFLAERVTNPTGDLMGAIQAMAEAHPSITYDDIVERAERATRLMARNGVVAIRTHVDATPYNGLVAVEALAEVRRRVAGVVELQIVALIGWPVVGVAGAQSRALLNAALDIGIDRVGGCPWLEDDPAAATEVLMDAAANAGIGVDFHTDETLDPRSTALEALVDAVERTGFDRPVTASHCVALGQRSEADQREIALRVAAAGIGVVVLPQTNLYLQGRDRQHCMPRALTAVGALRSAGARVAAGADNLQDPFNPVGRADPMETAALMVMAAHLSPQQAYDAVSTVAADVLGIDISARRLRVAGSSVREAIAFGPPGRELVATVP